MDYGLESCYSIEQDVLDNLSTDYVVSNVRSKIKAKKIVIGTPTSYHVRGGTFDKCFERAEMYTNTCSFDI